MNVETKELTNDSSTEVDPKSVKRSRSYRTGAVYGRASLWQQDNSTALVQQLLIYSSTKHYN